MSIDDEPEFEYLDMSGLDFADWIRFVFDHPLPAEGGQPWYFTKDVDLAVLSATRELHYFSSLCNDLENLVAPYSIGQVDQGLWMLLADNGPSPSLSECLFSVNDELYSFSAGCTVGQPPQESRLECIKSMYHAFADFLRNRPREELVETSFYMWWDLLCGDFWSRAAFSREQQPDRLRDGMIIRKRTGWKSTSWDEYLQRNSIRDDARTLLVERLKTEELPDDVHYQLLNSFEREILDTIFDTLSRLLTANDDGVEACTLHGLGHCHHPAAKSLVQRFIDEHGTDTDSSALKWLEQCRDGTVM